MDWVAWAASKVGLVDPIPYQPIGGIKRVRGGFVTPDTPGAARLAANSAHRLRGAFPAAEPHAHRRGAAAGRLGPRRADDPLRDAARPGEGLARARLPRAQHQDGRLAVQALAAGAGLAAELRRHRRRAGGPVPAVRHRHGRGGGPGLEEKFGPSGVYSRPGGVRAGLQGHGERPRPTCATPATTSKEAIEYTKEICRYLVETYGRFPAHSDAFHLPGIWVQFSHLEIEYYERFGKPPRIAPGGRGQGDLGALEDGHAGAHRHRSERRSRHRPEAWATRSGA